MLWQLIEVFGASHSASLQEASKSINRLTQINPTVWESRVKEIQEINEKLLSKW